MPKPNVMSGWIFLGLLAGLLALGYEAQAQLTLQPGDIQVLVQGTLELMSGQLYDEEKRLNPIQGSAAYVDGSVLDSEMSHEGWQYGFIGEYTITEQFGAQLGLEFRTITQKVSAGGGSYEEQVWGEGTLLSYTHPFLGFSYYALNEGDANLAFTARLGSVMAGKIYPEVSTYDYFAVTPIGYDLTGYTVGLGTSLAFIYDFFVFGASFFVTDNLFKTDQKIYPDLDRSFSTFSYDLSLYCGIRF